MFKNVASQKVVLYAYNSTTGAPVTGLTTGATFAPYVSINGAAPAALGTTTVTELDATNLPGWYAVQPSQSETNGDMLLFGGKSSTSNVYINGFPIFTDPPNYTTFSIDSSGNAKADVAKLLGTAWLTPGVAGTPDVNAKQLGGTAQTGRDVGASVLLSAGTGAGQLDFTSGVVKSNLVQILATALTETAGLLAGGFKKFFNVVAPTLTCLGVDQTGDNFARLGAPAGASVSADVAAINAKTTNLPAAPASTTNITAGTMTTVTTLTNLPSIPNNWLTAAGIAAAALNGKGDWSTVTPINLTAAQIATGIFQDATAGDFTVAGSIGKSIMNGVALGTGLTVNDLTTKTGYALTSAYDFAKGTVAMTESYAANGVAPTPVQALMAIHQDAMQFGISGVNYTVKKLDNSTTAFIKTLDSAVTPTAAVRT